MDLLHRIQLWGDRHHPKWIDIVRIALGIFLMYKGMEFPKNVSMYLNQMHDFNSFGSFSMVIITHYVVFAHLLGGFLLAIGVLTRFACLIQIPILLGAIIFVNSSYGLWSSQLLLSLCVLALLCYFLIVGNGPWAFDWFAARDRQQ